jgi:AmmeMemoRadiSam system protein A
MPHATEPAHPLPPEKGELLPRLARLTLAQKLRGPLAPADEAARQAVLDDPALQPVRATFVTLTCKKELRGCIGTLCAREPLSESVRSNALNAAFEDPRFPALTATELDGLDIEVSVLSAPSPLRFSDAQDLVRRLRPGVDGVVLCRGSARATFLPQVWEQLPQAEQFLRHLCLKAGLPGDAWTRPGIEVSIYQVQHFAERDRTAP